MNRRGSGSSAPSTGSAGTGPSEPTSRTTRTRSSSPRLANYHRAGRWTQAADPALTPAGSPPEAGTSQPSTYPPPRSPTPTTRSGLPATTRPPVSSGCTTTWTQLGSWRFPLRPRHRQLRLRARTRRGPVPAARIPGSRPAELCSSSVITARIPTPMATATATCARATSELDEPGRMRPDQATAPTGSLVMTRTLRSRTGSAPLHSSYVQPLPEHRRSVHASTSASAGSPPGSPAGSVRTRQPCPTPRSTSRPPRQGSGTSTPAGPAE